MFSRCVQLFTASLVLSTALLFTGGCQTYVNIPQQTGDVASSNMNGSNVRNLVGESLRGLRAELLAPGKYQVILPAGATPETYETILAIAGEPYTWADTLGSGNVVDKLEVRAIRVRGWEGSVDIIRSTSPQTPDAPKQLVTVYLKDYIVGGWASRNIRVWRMNVADALLISAGQPVGDGSGSPSDQPVSPSEDAPENAPEAPSNETTPSPEAQP